MSINAILDTDQDEKRRKREPMDLTYVVLSRPRAHAVPQPLIIDQNDPTGAIMQLLFPDRILTHRNGFIGFAAKNSMENKEIGLVTTNSNPFLLDAAKGRGQPVHSLGKDIIRISGPDQFTCGILVKKKKKKK